jgi:hypothetical protein
MRTKKTVTDKKADAPAESVGVAPENGNTDEEAKLLRWKEREKLMEGPDVLVNRETAALVLGISLNWLDKLLKKGFLPSTMRESRRIFSRNRLLAYWNSIETVSKDELQTQAFFRKDRELECAAVMERAANLYRRQVELLKMSLSGGAVNKPEMDEIRDRLLQAQENESRLLREIDDDAGVSNFFYAGEKKPGVRMERVVTGVRFVPNGCGGQDRVPIYEMREMDFSKQVVIESANKDKSGGRGR